jgi:uncharacterized protein
MAITRPAEPFAGLRGQRYLQLTTFRQSGAPVATPVWFAQEGGRLYVWTGAASGKARRLRRTPAVRVAPCSPMGAARSPAVPAVARILPAAEAGPARRALRAKYGWLLRLSEWVAGRRGEHVYLEIRPVEAAEAVASAARAA